jgi:hypothetical protein
MPRGGIGQESLKWFGMRLATVHKMKRDTHIEEPSNPIDSWHRIAARAPLTHGFHASKVYLLIDFEK